jgi:hypothetical protein
MTSAPGSSRSEAGSWRVEPLEIAWLRALLTAPQAVLDFEAHEVVTGIVLGREPEEER